MHEYGIAEELMKGLIRELGARGIDRVVEVRMRRASAFAPEALGQAFSSLSVGTPLAGAKLTVETSNVTVRCACGDERVVSANDLVGHLFMCPRCGAIHEVEEAHDLELIDVIVDEPEEVRPS